METKYNVVGIVNNGSDRRVILKAERKPGSPIDEKVTEILHQLDIDGTEEEKQAILEQVRIQLHNLFPSGNWISVSSREAILKEVERVKKQLQEDREEDPGASLRYSIKKAIAK